MRDRKAVSASHAAERSAAARAPAAIILLRVSASELKAIGWRRVLDLAEAHGGRVAITSHRRLQAVVLSPAAYEALLAANKGHRSSVPSGLEFEIAALEARVSAVELRVSYDYLGEHEPATVVEGVSPSSDARRGGCRDTKPTD